eukprot:CAMPEP_0182507268 /NCGR_PEP_ID=MMETSP1321-20130603/22781_1 /TAXON_ID=91990 /ORGANISM="Bolidomonas sp., Strain RCC1657" /LENGTH=37 /DNA_ID= /DNA_START= /DNA_END= /DNA_ORIENTATION=
MIMLNRLQKEHQHKESVAPQNNSNVRSQRTFTASSIE